ncbi:Flagellar assembly protein FliH/Type III secretion system HrpE [Syntrophobotulus glycolicus DSM 8271]|uniref:Flagellar assembly protein FliH/Type III secretion system HrpE n=1 Tax=Syntrophobotulus glycolicus (strain DSM 8271 / FlGlyR) TaxID=645991 RepID=F0SZF5_SYNGF|nr:FliH/SctL family protein [Syntrophobotulus glycolicus]ADY54960.1 Flagellar assembly protein FliH/Type III secretion system HrpE [Syntrophobotulus glycolicus DSM 8271]
MKLFIKDKVLKNCSIEIVGPRIVESVFEFPESVFRAETEACFEELPGEEPDDHLNAVMEETERILEQAKKEALDILTEAKEKARAVLARAEEQGAEIRLRVQEEVRREIVPQIKAETIAGAEQEIADTRFQAQSYFDLACKAMEIQYEKAEKDILSLAVKIAEKIIGVSLKIEPGRLQKIIRSCPLLNMGKENVRIHVSLPDFAWLNDLPEGQKLLYPFVADESLLPGDLYIESDEGAFDLRIASQLEKLQNALIGELTNGGLDKPGQ